MIKEILAGRWDALQAKTPPLIGVDLSSSAVKMVELSEAGPGRYRIERYVIEALPKDTMVDGNVNQLDVASEAMRRAWDKLGTRVRNVALALPAAAVITQKVVLPAHVSEEEMEIHVQGEANQYIPFALDEVNLDFQVLGPASSGPDEVEVLLAASRKDKIEDRVATAEAAGLKTVVMDAESFALQSAVELLDARWGETERSRVVAVVDLGASTMRITLLHRGEAVYVREQPIGGNQLTEAIASRFNLPLNEAESAKVSNSLPESYSSEVLRPFFDGVVAEIARALQFFFTSTQFSQVDQIVLAGGSAMLKGLDDVVAAHTQVPTVVANPFARMALSPRIKPRRLTLHAPALLVACGLALRRFD